MEEVPRETVVCKHEWEAIDFDGGWLIYCKHCRENKDGADTKSKDYEKGYEKWKWLIYFGK